MLSADALLVLHMPAKLSHSTQKMKDTTVTRVRSAGTATIALDSVRDSAWYTMSVRTYHAVASTAQQIKSARYSAGIPTYGPCRANRS
jgi:hypothetical protein